MNRDTAKLVARRIISYSTWVNRKFNFYARSKALLFAICATSMIYLDFELTFVALYVVPTLIVVCSIFYFARIANNVIEDEKLETHIEDIFVQYDGDLEIGEKNNFSLSEVYQYESVIEKHQASPEKKIEISNIDLIGKLSNPLPRLLMLFYMWGLAVEIPLTLTLIFISLPL